MLPKRSCRYLILTLGLLPLAASCSIFRSERKIEERRPPYEAYGELDETYFHSPEGDIVGHFPSGWLQVNVEDIPSLEGVLFVYTDPLRKRALILSEIPGVAALRRSVERDGLLALCQASISAKSVSTNGKITLSRQPEVFVEAGKLFASYEYLPAGQSLGGPHKEVRSVDFTTGVRFYELSLVELAPPFTENQRLENFRLLEAVIGQIEGAAEINGSVSGSQLE